MMYDQIKNAAESCILNKAILYTAMDDLTTPFASMSGVDVLIGAKDYTTAESGAGTPCTAELLAAGAPCESSFWW